MKFAFSASPALKKDTKYSGKITNISFLDVDTDKERVLVNVMVEGYSQPSPASYATANETGARLFSDLIRDLGGKKNNCTSVEKVTAFLKGKVVTVVVKENGEYSNTRLSVPKTTDEEGEEPTL